ncbi:SusC/RagA family TonB-linked outer membrane protein, partial [Marinilabiliaceae bacterium AAT]|nr:SusC/RagA family TonB-linked outer membrane protein [Plebeiobacterium sediminum]
NGNWGPRYDGQMRPWGNVVDNSQQVAPFSYIEDRINDFFEYGLNYKNSISAYGGNANTDYFLSFTQNSVDGIYPEDVDSYDRYTISTKASHKTEKLKVSTSINFSTEKTNAVPMGQGSSA